MESLMREMGGLGATDGNVLDGAAGIGGGAGEGGAGKKTEKELEQERAFRAAWEAMLVEGMDGMVGDEYKPGALPAFSGTSDGSTGAGVGAEGKKEKEGVDTGEKKDFQAGIRAAMEKLKSSESGFKVSLSIPSPFSSLLLPLLINGHEFSTD